MDMPVANLFFQESADTANDAAALLVLGSRILANEGVFDAYGHISIRNPENNSTFFISRSVSPEFMCIDDVLEVDFDCHVVNGRPGCRTHGETAIHSSIYAARPDVNCVCHSHTPEFLPFAASNLCFDSVTHQHVSFYDGTPVFSSLVPESGGMVNTPEQGKQLASVLGGGRSVLLKNHGIVIVGESVPRVVYSSITARDNARILMQLLSVGAKIDFLSKEVQECGCYRQFCKPGLAKSWEYWCKKATMSFPDIII